MLDRSFSRVYSCFLVDAEEDEQIEDDCSLHNSLHAVLAKGGIVKAYPETCAVALSCLKDYLKGVIGVVLENREKDDMDEVEEVEMTAAIAEYKAQRTGFCLRNSRDTFMYPFVGNEEEENDGVSVVHMEVSSEDYDENDVEKEDIISKDGKRYLLMFEEDEKFIEDESVEEQVKRVKIDDESDLIPGLPKQVLDPVDITHWIHRRVNYSDSFNPHPTDGKEGLRKMLFRFFFFSSNLLFPETERRYVYESKVLPKNEEEEEEDDDDREDLEWLDRYDDYESNFDLMKDVERRFFGYQYEDIDKIEIPEEVVQVRHAEFSLFLLIVFCLDTKACRREVGRMCRK